MINRQVADRVVELLKNDVNVKSETVRLELIDENWKKFDETRVIGEVAQIEFYCYGNPDESWDAAPTSETESKIESLGVRVQMNDCEGCFGEGVVWAR